MLGTSSFVVPTVRYVCQINGANRKHHIDFFLVQNAAVSISKAKTWNKIVFLFLVNPSTEREKFQIEKNKEN